MSRHQFVIPRDASSIPSALSGSRDAVTDVGHTGGLQHPDEFHLGDAGLEAVEQPFTRAEDHRRHLQVDLVDDARPVIACRAHEAPPAIEMSFPPAAASACA